MFALPVAGAQTKAAASSTNKVTQQRSKLVAWRANQHERGANPVVDQVRMPTRGTQAMSWDFNKIPIFSPDRSKSPLVAAPLPGAVQFKLAVRQGNDPLEHEADRVADQVMRMPVPEMSIATAPLQVSRKCAACQETEKEWMLRTKPPGSPTAGGEAPGIVHDVLRSPGRPLEPASRAYFTPRFGYDFSQVRIHDGEQAAASARSVGALAYTVGRNIVFGSGQYGPATAEGTKLLAHELTHVVQQRSVRPLDDKFARRLEISRVPTRLMFRLGPESDEEERKKEAEDPRNKAIKRHEEQQRRVVEYLDKARKIQPDAKKGFRNPDNLFRNTVGLLDGGKLTLTILSPTHYSPNLHFDSRVKHPKIGGDYPADRKAPAAGLIFDDTNAFGTVLPSSAPAPPNPIQTLPPKVEHTPGESEPAPTKIDPVPAKTSSQPQAVPALPGEMLVFTRGLDLTEDGFKNTFVHEGQHVADLHPRLPKASSWSDLLEAYKSEFRAFWIQPPPPRVGGIAPQSIDNLPEPTGRAGKPDNSSKLTISHSCTICPAPNPSAKAFEEHKTGMRNARQERIFWYIMSNYKAQEYDCCYVYNDAFHREVNRFSVPESVNLINSDRMMNLNLALHTLNLSMTVSQVVGTQLTPLLTALEPLDWAFLKDTTLSAPFWTLLDGNAPKFVHDAIKALEKSGTRKQVTEAEVTAALSGS